MKIEFSKEDIEKIRRIARREAARMISLSTQEMNEFLRADELEDFK